RPQPAAPAHGRSKAHAFESWSATSRSSAVPTTRPQRRSPATRGADRSESSDATSGLAEAAGLVLHALACVRDGLEPLARDRLAGVLAQPVGALLESLERRVDLLDRLQRRRGTGEVEVPLDRQGVALARLVVELHVPGLAAPGQRIGLVAQGLRLGLEGGTLPQERLLLGRQELLVERRLTRAAVRGPGGRLLGGS